MYDDAEFSRITQAAFEANEKASDTRHPGFELSEENQSGTLHSGLGFFDSEHDKSLHASLTKYFKTNAKNHKPKQQEDTADSDKKKPKPKIC